LLHSFLVSGTFPLDVVVEVVNNLTPSRWHIALSTSQCLLPLTIFGLLPCVVLPFASGSADIPVGTPILVMVEDEEDVPAFANYEATAATAAPAVAPAAKPVSALTPTPMVAPSPGTAAAPVLSASNSALDPGRAQGCCQGRI
jgi:hypothetical protein